MRREQVTELHYITPLANLPSIARRGILSHGRAQMVEHESAAMEEIQERRERVRVPGGRALHEYVNLYFHARNPMMYKRQEMHMDLAILRVIPDVLDIPRTMVTDFNASVAYVRFAPAPGGIAVVDHELVYAEWWTHENPIEMSRRRAAKCAEVLVPDRVDSAFIAGCYVSCPESLQRVEQLGIDITPTINRWLFFRGR